MPQSIEAPEGENLANADTSRPGELHCGKHPTGSTRRAPVRPHQVPTPYQSINCGRVSPSESPTGCTTQRRSEGGAAPYG